MGNINIGTLNPSGLDVAIGGHSKPAQNTFARRKLIHGPMVWAEFRSRQRWNFEPELNFGVPGDLPMAGSWGGNAYPGIYDRLIGPVDASFGAVPQNFLATTTAGVIILEAFTNYWNLAGVTGDTAIAIAKLLQSAVLGAGKRLVWKVDDPRGNTANTGNRLSSTNLAHAMKLRNWMLNEAMNTPGVGVIDSWSSLAIRGSSLGDIQTGLCRSIDYVGGTSGEDALHVNQSGASRTGKDISRYLDTLFPPRNILPASNADVYSANNPRGVLSANPAMVGTGGALNGHTGFIADSWNYITNSISVSFTGSKVTTTSFNGVAYTDEPSKDWQQTVISGTPTAITEIIVMAQTISTNIVVGDLLRAISDIEWDSLVNVSSLTLAVVDSTNTTVLAATFDNSSDLYVWTMPNAPEAGVMKTPFTTGVAATTARLQIRLKPAVANVAMSGTFRNRLTGMQKFVANS